MVINREKGGGQRLGEGEGAFVRQCLAGAGDEPFNQAAGVRHERHATDLWFELRLFKERVDYKSVTLS